MGVATAYRCVREAGEVLAALAPTLDQAVQAATAKAFVILDCPARSTTSILY